MTRATPLIPAALLLLGGCYSADELGLGSKEPSPVGQEDYKVAWTDRDDPQLFDDDLEYARTALPQQGEAQVIPWAGSYWPVFEDSINARWAGRNTQSPAAKYGAAFGVADLEDTVSAHYGIDKHATRTACTEDGACNAEIGEACAIREGETEGRCIPTWWGICHAWAPVSIMEPEPLHPVTRNGVTFQVQDIKALLSLSWDKTSSKFVSLRCNEDNQAGEIDYDGYDRPTGSDVACRDTNPGTYHVLLANYLGLRGASFVEDRTFDDEVWNQPLRGYRITRQEEVSAQDANELVGVTPGGDGSEPPAPRVTEFSGDLAQGAWHHEAAIAVSGGERVTVSMTGRGDSDLYVAFGHQPSDSNWVCRPWLNGSVESCVADVPSRATEVFVSVNGYTANSSYDVKVEVHAGPTGGSVPTDYRFNDEAAKLYYVELEVDYIAESPASLDGNLGAVIDRYTHTDHYEYILEVDAQDRVIGGEWVGSSKENHPDFLWLPTGRKESVPIAGGAINYALVRELLDASIAGPGEPATQVRTQTESGSLAPGEWAHFGPFENVEGAFRAEMTGTGDADLYVRKDAQPTQAAWNCRPYRNGSVEDCTESGAGSWFVSVRGYTASSFDLLVTWTSGVDGEPPSGDDDDAPTGPGHLDESGHVDQGEWARYTLAVTAGQTLLVRTEAASDVDLYLRLGAEPTSATYDVRRWTTSGDETAEWTAPASGTLHIGVHGYEAADFRLTTADE